MTASDASKSESRECASVFPAEVSEGIVVAFAVDDIVGAREELAAAKVELIGELVWTSEPRSRSVLADVDSALVETNVGLL
jgi:hypothetical protein